MKTLAEIIEPAPAAGSGLHAWSYYAANAARGWGFTAEAAAAFLMAEMQRAGRPERQARREAEHSIRRAFGAAPLGGSLKGWPSLPPRPAVKPDAAAMREAATSFATVDLWEESPVRFDEPAGAFIYEKLFGPNPETLVCIARAHPRDSQTLPLGEALPLVGSYALTCQNVMTAREGLTLEGTPSPRTLNNIGPRRWVVLEFDASLLKIEWVPILARVNSLDACAGLLWKLHEVSGALRVVCHSGGKSLHGWFDCKGWPELEIARLYDAGQKLGADLATKTANQLVRIPDGLRENGARQTCYYLNLEGLL